MDFTSIATVVALALGLVQFIKSLGLTGNVLRIVSMAVAGLIFGAFKAQEIWPAAATYIQLVLFMVGGGLAACGYYDLLKPVLKLDSNGKG